MRRNARRLYRPICHGTALTVALLATGCSLIQSQTGADRVSIRGIQPRVEQIDFTGVAAKQTALIGALAEQAQLKGVTLGYDDPRWSLVLRAGLQLVDGRCDQYLDALFRFNREQRAARQELTAATAATAGIMGLTGAPGRAIAVVATALGLASNLFDASVNSVLFQIEPSALRNVVIQGRVLYIRGLSDQTDKLRAIDNRPDMMLALQGYLTQCSPAAIEANINNAANGSPFAVTTPGLLAGSSKAAISTGTPAVSLVGPAVRLSDRTLPPPPPLAAIEPAPRLPGAEQLIPSGRARVQAALGLPRTPDLGLPGGPTSRAIAEFQAAMAARDGGWPADPPGTLAGFKTRQTLIGLPPMPPTFRTPFERFYLGNEEALPNPSGQPIQAFTVPDPDQMNELRDRLALPPAAPGTDLWDGVRPALAAARARLRSPAPGGAAAGTLDSRLLAALRNPAPL